MLLGGDIAYMFMIARYSLLSFIPLIFQYLGLRIFVFFFLLQAARETGALQAAKNKLEKQVEDLTLRLQLEKRMRVNVCEFS